MQEIKEKCTKEMRTDYAKWGIGWGFGGTVLYSEPEFLLSLGVSFSRPGQTLKMRGSAKKPREQGRLTGEIFVGYPL